MEELEKEIEKLTKELAECKQNCINAINSAVDDEVRRRKTAWCDDYLRNLRKQLQSQLNAAPVVGTVELNAQIKILDRIIAERCC